MRRNRRGKEQRLLFLRYLGNYFFDIVDKAHVKHAVRLIQDKNLHLIQLDKPLPDQVVQPPGRRHQDVHTPLERLYLVILVDAAEDHTAAQPQKTPVGSKAVENL